MLPPDPPAAPAPPPDRNEGHNAFVEVVLAKFRRGDFGPGPGAEWVGAAECPSLDTLSERELAALLWLTAAPSDDEPAHD